MGGLRPRAALPGLLRDALLLLTLQTRSESRPSPPAPRGQVLPGRWFWELMGHTRVVLAVAAHRVPGAAGLGAPQGCAPRRGAAAAAQPGQDAALSPGQPRAPSASIPRKAITVQQITGLIKSHYAISESKSDPGAAN